MKYGAVVESIQNPGTFGTTQYSTFGVSVHYWHHNVKYGKVMTKTLGANWEDFSNYWKFVPLPAWGKVDEHGCVSFDHDHCPVCGSKLHKETDYMDGHILCEEHVRCTGEQKCYQYAFAYGTYEEWVGGRDWGWSYHASTEDRQAISAEVNTEIIKMREALYAKA